jgi:hypothetical protein
LSAKRTQGVWGLAPKKRHRSSVVATSCCGKVIRAFSSKLDYLGGKREGEAKLVGGLVETLGVSRETKTQGDAGTEDLVVGDGGDTLGVDHSLSEGGLVQSVLGTDLEANVLAGLRVPGGLGGSLGEGVDLVVVGGGEDREGVSSGDGGGVGRGGVAEGSRVLGDLAVENVVANLRTGEEALVADGHVTSEGWALEKIKETAGMESWLLEVDGELSVLSTGGWDEGGGKLALEAWGEGLVDLNLGVKDVGSGPALGESHARGLVGVLGLNRTRDGALMGLLALGSEGNAVWRLGLDLKVTLGKVVEVLGEKVRRSLADVTESWNRHYDLTGGGEEEPLVGTFYLFMSPTRWGSHTDQSQRSILPSANSSF